MAVPSALTRASQEGRSHPFLSAYVSTLLSSAIQAYCARQPLRSVAADRHLCGVWDQWAQRVRNKSRRYSCRFREPADRLGHRTLHRVCRKYRMPNLEAYRSINCSGLTAAEVRWKDGGRVLLSEAYSATPHRENSCAPSSHRDCCGTATRRRLARENHTRTVTLTAGSLTSAYATAYA